MSLKDKLMWRRMAATLVMFGSVIIMIEASKHNYNGLTIISALLMVVFTILVTKETK